MDLDTYHSIKEDIYTAVGLKLGFGPARKLSRIVDHKSQNINNIGRLMIGDPRELWRGPNSKFQADCSIPPPSIILATAIGDDKLMQSRTVVSRIQGLMGLNFLRKRYSHPDVAAAAAAAVDVQA